MRGDTASFRVTITPQGRHNSGGFTLLEMMVVMVLMGLLTTLVLPAMQRWHDGVQVRSQVAAIVEALHAAAFAAPASRKNLVMDARSFVEAAAPAASSAASSAGAVRLEDPAQEAKLPSPNNDRGLLHLALPQGWKAERVSPVEFLPNGLCAPGYAALRTERGVPVRVEVRGPICAIATSNTESER